MDQIKNLTNEKKEEMKNKAFKYFVMLLIVSSFARLILPKSIDNNRVVSIAIVSAISFAILDIYMPSIVC
jgi:ABC-type Co2+ transport system permease subunit